MAGEHKELQARFKEVLPYSVYTHCHGHQLNLVMIQTCECVLPATVLFQLEAETATFLSELHLRLDVWKDAASSAFVGAGKLRILVKKINGTRWWTKGKGVNQLFGNDSLLPVLIYVLDSIYKDTKFKLAVRTTANGLLKKWTELQVVVVGVTFQQIFQHADPTSKYLQSKEVDFLQSYRMTKKLIDSIEKSFVEIMKKARNLMTECNVTLKSYETKMRVNIQTRFNTEFQDKRIPRCPKRPGELADDERRQLAAENGPEWRQRVEVVEPIPKKCLSELRDRFASNSNRVYKACALLNPERFSEIERDGVPEKGLALLYTLAKVDEEKERNELNSFAKNYMGLCKSIGVEFRSGEDHSCDVDLQEDAKDSDIEDDNPKDRKMEGDKACCKKGCLRCPYSLLRKYGLYQAAYKTLCEVYKVALTLPCTQVTCERSFSKLKIIKSRLRNAMSEDMLQPCMLLAIERDLVDRIDRDEVIEKYASSSKGLGRLLHV